MAKRQRRKLSKTRYSESYTSKDQGGSTRIGVFDFKGNGYNDVKFYKPKEKINKIIIVPYEIKSKNHPLVKSGKVDVGDLDYLLDVWVHRRVGASEADILCPKKTYGKPCPLCDISSNLYNEYISNNSDETKKKYDALKAKRRVIYNLLTVEKGEVAEQLQVFEVSHFLFEKELIEEANDCLDGKDIINFADPEEGCIIKFRKSIDKSGGFEMPKYKSFDFLEREEEIDDDIIDQAVSFDECLKVLTPDEIMALYNGEDEEEEDAPVKSKKTTKRKKVVEAEEEEEEEKPVKKRTTKKGTRKAKPKVVEEDEDEEEEEEEQPIKKKTTTKRKKKIEEPEEDEDDGQCPHGHTFGEDCDSFKHCDRCEIWEECMEASEEE